MSVFPRYLSHLDSGKVDFLQECRRQLSSQYGIDDIRWNCVLICQPHIEKMCYKKFTTCFFRRNRVARVLYTGLKCIQFFVGESNGGALGGDSPPGHQFISR